MITIRGVSKAFGAVRVLSDVSLTAEEGKTTVLLGAKDAGKTTLCDILTGALAPDGGTVLVDGYDIVEDPQSAKRHIGYMPQDASLYRDMTPRAQLRFVAQAREMSARVLAEQVDKVLAQTKLTEVANVPIRQLPNAYLARMGLAQAMLGEVRSMVLDCPTRGLDAKQIFELRECIAAAREGMALLVATDSPAEALALGDVAYVLEAGRVVCKCGPNDIAIAEADDDYTEIVCEGEESAVREAARKAESSCEKCEVDAGFVRATLHTGKGAQARKAVFRAFAQADLPIIDMRPAHRTLEQIVLSLASEPISASGANAAKPAPSEGAEKA